jgi:uncharacterized protein (UPF0303 family)
MDTEKRGMSVAEQKEEYQKLLNVLEEQEKDLQFGEFTNEQALEIGLNIIAKAQQENKAVAIDIARSGQQLFHYAMPGTTPDNDQWMARKINVVKRFQKSSFHIATILRSKGQTFEQEYYVSSMEYAPVGGSFPIIIKNVGAIGTITVSGLPDHEDHALVVGVIKEYLKKK